MEWSQFPTFLFWMLMTTAAFDAMLLSVAAAAKNMIAAQVLVMPVVMIPILFSGLLVSRNTCPDYLMFMLDISPLNYVMEYLTYKFYGEGCDQDIEAALIKVMAMNGCEPGAPQSGNVSLACMNP